MFSKEIMLYKFSRYYIKTWHLLIKELKKLEKTIYKNLDDNEVINASLVRYNIISLKTLLVDLLTRKKESIDGFSVLVDSYGELILLYLEAQNLKKQIKRKHYYEKVEEKEYKNIDDAISHMPNENIDRIFMNAFTDQDINICEVYCKRNISEMVRALENTNKGKAK